MRKTKTKKQSVQPQFKGDIGQIDMPFFMLILALLAMGLIMLASASYATNLSEYGDSYHDIKRQLIFAVLGVVGMLGVAYFDYHRLRKFAFPVLVIAAVMLVIVLLPTPISYAVGDANRWIKIGGLTFQPSEIGKFAIILGFSQYISRNFNRLDEFKVGPLPLFATLAVIVFLIAIETHLSGAIITLVTGTIVLFVGGIQKRWIALTYGVCGVGAFALISFTSYMGDRITAWLHPFDHLKDKGWQVVQSLYAIGSGGLFGVGLGQSRQKHNYLPEAANDYIFSIACEELGLVGAIFIIFLFAMLVWRGFMIAMRARDKFGSLLAIGITSRVAVQTILNIAVVTNTLPSTGITLPFFSYGGTALVILLLEMGIVLSVSRFGYLDKTPPTPQKQIQKGQ